VERPPLSLQIQNFARKSSSGGYGPIKVAQGIVGYADLALGDRVEPVLEALIRAGDVQLDQAAGVRELFRPAAEG